MSLPTICLLPLGTCAGNKTIYQHQSSYLLKIKLDSEELQFLFDAGSNRIIDNRYVDLNKLKMIVLSHAHLDHSHYLSDLFKKLDKNGFDHAIHLIGHIGTLRILSPFMKILQGTKIPGNVNFIPVKLDSRKKKSKPSGEIIDGYVYKYHFRDDSELIIRFSHTNAFHSPDCIATKIDVSFNKSKLIKLVYSPDTRFDSFHLTKLAENADYWMLDSTFNDNWIEKTKKGVGQTHSSPKYSGIMCDRAKVKNYIAVHHFWERFAEEYSDTESAIKKSASEKYRGNIIVPKDLEEIQLYPPLSIK